MGIRPSERLLGWAERLGRRSLLGTRAEVVARGSQQAPPRSEPPVIDVEPSPARGSDGAPPAEEPDPSLGWTGDASGGSLSAPDFEPGWWRMPPVGRSTDPEPFPAELLRPRSPRWLRRLRVAAAETVRQPLVRQLIGAAVLAAAVLGATSIPGTIGREAASGVLWTLHRDYDPVALARGLVGDVPGLKTWLQDQGIALPAALVTPPPAAAPASPAPGAAPTSSASPYTTPMGPLTPPLQAPVAVAFGAPVLVAGGGGKTAPSQGILFWATASTPVHAIAAGQVLAAAASATLGQYVLLNHLDGWSSLYAHCESLLVHPGDHVSRGQPVCTTGRVGSQFGPYLYFELRRDGKPVDPGPYLGLKEPVSR